jgi:hypothetical protein
VIGLAVELAANDAQRLPSCGEAFLSGVRLPRLAVAAGVDPLPAVLAALGTSGLQEPKMDKK